MELRRVEELFNQLFDFNNLVNDATRYVEDILIHSDTNFLSEEGTNETSSFNMLRIEYKKTQLLINETGRMPYFRLVFNLYEYNMKTPKYVYEIEYDSSGEFSDEYFSSY